MFPNDLMVGDGNFIFADVHWRNLRNVEKILIPIKKARKKELTKRAMRFNSTLSSVRSVVERNFTLKDKFKRFSNRRIYYYPWQDLIQHFAIASALNNCEIVSEEKDLEKYGFCDEFFIRADEDINIEDTDLGGRSNLHKLRSNVYNHDRGIICDENSPITDTPSPSTPVYASTPTTPVSPYFSSENSLPSSENNMELSSIDSNTGSASPESTNSDSNVASDNTPILLESCCSSSRISTNTTSNGNVGDGTSRDEASSDETSSDEASKESKSLYRQLLEISQGKTLSKRRTAPPSRFTPPKKKQRI